MIANVHIPETSKNDNTPLFYNMLQKQNIKIEII